MAGGWLLETADLAVARRSLEARLRAGLEGFDAPPQGRGRRNAEDVVDAVGPTPVENLGAAIVAVGAQQDFGARPVGADGAQQPAQEGSGLLAAGPFGGAEDGGDEAARAVEHDDRLKSVFVVMGVEQPQLLAAVNRVEGVVEVERDPLGNLAERRAIEIDHGAAHPQQRPVARKAALARVHDLASNGLRAVAVASRPWTGPPRDPTANDETNLAFEGLCIFADPPKATAPAAVARLAAAGVRVVILSGDDPLVVGRLAKIVGLRAQQAIAGADLNVLSTDALRVQTRDTDIFARLSPDQKVRIVHALRDAGEIVGFMGDGVNDAPGIKAADIGLSVDGATGVARAAADMILLDSDLAVVADGVEEGRRTFANILKYIRMGASSNFGNMLSMAAASLFLPFLPMLATQILLNNLLYDVSEIGIPFDNVRATDIAQPQAGPEGGREGFRVLPL